MKSLELMTYSGKKVKTDIDVEKLSEIDFIEIEIGVELYDDAGNTTIQFKSMTDCAKYLNVSIALINKVLNGKCVKNKYNIRRIKNERL